VKEVVMPYLPSRPDLQQLRHQAKDLLHAAKAGDSDAGDRMRAVSDRLVLASAQLALAREYGFSSWPALKREVERRDALNSRDASRLSDLLRRDPELAVTRMVNWDDHKSANPLGYIAMIGFDHERLGLPADLPGTGQIAQALIAGGAPINGLYGDTETPLMTAYALLSTYVSQKLERNDEIDRAAEVGVTLRDGNGQPRRKLGPRTINMSLDVISRVLNDAVKRGLLPNNPAADSQLRLKVQQRRGNFLEADELLAVIDAGGEIDEPVSPQTVARAELARNLRAQGRQWKEIAAELEVATSTAIWLAGRYRVDAGSGARRAILATLGCAGLRNSELSI
jgi:hypothetical protein